MSVIEVTGLTKRYRKTRAVDGIDFDVEPGQIFGFLGPNGSGKTTTIGMLLGVTRPTAGEIRLFGEYGVGRLRAARQRIGATLETPNFYPYLSGRNNLRIVARLKGVASDRIGPSLEEVGLGGAGRKRFKAYSLGMKQRLALASAMLGDPELIILDEPTNGLDPEGIREVREIIRQLGASGRTIFLSSHLLGEVEKVCTHVAVIREGKLVARGPVAEIVGRAPSGVLRSEDPEALLRALSEHRGIEKAWREDERVVVELGESNLAEVNRYLADRGIYVSLLAPRIHSLEDAFLDLTRDPAGPGASASGGDTAEAAEAANMGRDRQGAS